MDGHSKTQLAIIGICISAALAMGIYAFADAHPKPQKPPLEATNGGHCAQPQSEFFVTGNCSYEVEALRDKKP